MKDNIGHLQAMTAEAQRLPVLRQQIGCAGISRNDPKR
jgi:hypothetical protein